MYSSTTTEIIYVLHSAYPDGSWRGIEKCCGTHGGATLVFDTREEAELYLKNNKLDPHFQVVPVTLTTPSVRCHLRSAVREFDSDY